MVGGFVTSLLSCLRLRSELVVGLSFGGRT